MRRRAAPRTACLALALAGEAPPDFQRDVLPLLADRCFLCHGPDASSRKRGLRLDTEEGSRALLKSGRRAIVPGDPAASELARRIAGGEGVRPMPPADFARPLAEDERALLLRWVAAGAPYARHWAFEPPRRAAPPAVAGPAWCRDPLDRYVLARLEEEGLAPAPEADRATLLRRAALILNGVAPTPDESARFVADDAPGAWERELDRLFASPRYGEQMAAGWLDVARFADTYGYQSDWECTTWPWRDWLIDAFQRDLPWDRFVVEQLAGDLLPGATREQRLATAFNRLHRQTNEGGSIDEEFRQEHVADRVATWGTAFLGLTLECARCHDHKYDPIRQEDFHRVGAFFAAIDEAGSYPFSTGATPRPALALPGAEQEAELARRAAALGAAESALAAAREAARDGALASVAQLPSLAVAPPSRHEPLDGGAPGPSGSATALDGDRGPSFDPPPFRRCDPLSVRLQVSCPDSKRRATVLHTSRFTIESDPQGFQLLLEEGRLSWQVLHYWPGSAAAIRSKEAFPIGRFVDLVATWDGSGRAAGLRLFLDGREIATEVVRDELDGPAPARTLQVGFRDRDVGLAGGAADELELWDRELGALEVAELHAPGGFAARRDALLASGETAALLELGLARDPAVAAAAALLRDARARLHELEDALPRIMVMEATRWPRPAYVLERGRYDQPDLARPLLQDAALPALLPFAPEWPHDRLGLASWTVAPENPLAARVAVNRFFALVFGRGLVETQENFGTQGARPSHPELLDALALDFVESGWRVQALLRRLLSSATFRQVSAAGAELFARDPDNRLLARGPARRLTGEELRDQALHAAGLLVERVGGRSVKPWQPPGLWEEAGATGSYQPDTGDDAHRRSLYTYRKRTAPPPGLLLFDAGSRETCLARRVPTSTPLQPLALLNDPVFVEAAVALARRVAQERADEPGRLARAFERLAARAPDAAELAALLELHAGCARDFAEDRTAAGLLLGVAPEAAEPSLAALALCCSTLLACDATVVLR